MRNMASAKRCENESGPRSGAKERACLLRQPPTAALPRARPPAVLLCGAALAVDVDGKSKMSISDQGAMQITVDSGIGEYNYILPAQTK